ncbi:MAG TPA: hypothetical protein VFY65_03540, partial [Longimicrobium sp.]|nr:hypothetical protein [Longimicrobium sp.]
MTMRRLGMVTAAMALGACAAAASGTVAVPTAAPADGVPAGECDIAPGTLVNVQSVDRTIRTEVRYATRNNFTGA